MYNATAPITAVGAASALAVTGGFAGMPLPYILFGGALLLGTAFGAARTSLRTRDHA